MRTTQIPVFKFSQLVEYTNPTFCLEKEIGSSLRSFDDTNKTANCSYAPEMLVVALREKNKRW